jgi:hypothetical protein
VSGVGTDLPGGDEAGHRHAGPAHLAEVQLVAAGRAGRDPVVGEHVLLPLPQVVLQRGPAAGEVGGGVAAGGEQDGEGEVVADQVEDPGRIVAVHDLEPGAQERRGRLGHAYSC